ncbi:hypothetical protein SAMN05216294_3144 [Flagellimonas zhangzhouensis]|nr:hypothetical protein SAMN05216294_3144 [Allomuricauda zhangzhouensis]
MDMTFFLFVLLDLFRYSSSKAYSEALSNPNSFNPL